MLAEEPARGIAVLELALNRTQPFHLILDQRADFGVLRFKAAPLIGDGLECVPAQHFVLKSHDTTPAPDKLTQPDTKSQSNVGIL